MQCRKRWCAWFIGVMFRRREKVGVGRFLSVVLNDWTSVLVVRTLVVHWSDEEEICRAHDFFPLLRRIGEDVPRRCKAGYRILHSWEGRTPAVQTARGRRRSSGRVPRRESKHHGIPLVVQLSDFDQQVIQSVGEKTELFHFRARGIEKAPG